jgi:HTH-like domain
MKYRLIGAEKAQHPVSLPCKVLGVSRSGFHAWLKRTPSRRWLGDVRLLEPIHEIHRDSQGTYGSPRVHPELRHRGVRVGRKRVERLMRRHGLSGVPKRRRTKTTVRVPGVRPAPDLVRRDFRPSEPDRLWVADLTEVSTWEGKLYLAVVLDCFSRRVSAGSGGAHAGRARRRGARDGGRSPQARGRARPPLRPGLLPGLNRSSQQCGWGGTYRLKTTAWSGLSPQRRRRGDAAVVAEARPKGGPERR